MKKISLKNLQVNEVEQLSKEQLKEVLGGTGGFTTTEYREFNCYCPGPGNGSTSVVRAKSEADAVKEADGKSSAGGCSCVEKGAEV